MCFFSIITPCYNSSQTIESAFDSLLKQSFNDFEWILVDDCSTDNGKTRFLIEQIKSKAPFKVKALFLDDNYFGSKSVYTGCSVAEGKFVAVLDHDDQLTPNALLLVKKYIDSHGDDQSIAGVCGRCVNENGDLIGKKFDSDSFIANEGQVRFVQGITEELFQFSRLELIKPYFELMKPGYINLFVWANISRNFNYIYVNDVLRVYDTALPSSSTNTKGMSLRYPAARAEAHREIIMSYRPYFKSNVVFASRMIGSYLRHNINANTNFFLAISGFDLLLKMWCLLLYPVALIKAKWWLNL